MGPVGFRYNISNLQDHKAGEVVLLSRSKVCNTGDENIGVVMVHLFGLGARCGGCEHV